MSGEDNQFKREMLATLPSLRAFAMSLTGRHDKADDLVQDTIMKAWAKQSGFELGTNMKAWLFTILRNEFYSQMRKRGREVQDTDGVFSDNLAVHPSQYGSLDLQDSARRWKSCRTTSAKRSSWSAHPASPTRKRRKSADAPSAPSRAASTAPASGCRNSSPSRGNPISDRTPCGRRRCRSPSPADGAGRTALPDDPTTESPGGAPLRGFRRAASPAFLCRAECVYSRRLGLGNSKVGR